MAADRLAVGERMAVQQQAASAHPLTYLNLRARYRFLAAYLASVLTLSIGFMGHALGFIIVARSLESSDIGHLAMITAASNLGAVWVELGVCEMARRRIGRDPSEYPAVLGHAAIVVLGFGSVIATALALIIAAFFHIDPSFEKSLAIAALIVPANVILFVFIGFAEQVIVAHENLGRANLINVGYGLSRIAVAGIACFGFGVSTLSAWAPWYLANYAVVCAACLVAIWAYGPPRWTVLWDEIPRGASMSVWGFLHVLRQNVDLMALSIVATPAFIGNYSVARRVLSAAAMVGLALDRVLYSRLVIVAREGVAAATRMVTKYAAYLSAPLLATSAAVFIAAPLVPEIFGAKYVDAAHVVRVLCGIIVAWSLQNLAFDALNASEKHGIRLLVSVAAAAVGCGMICGGAYLFGVDGMLIGVMSGELLITLALWSTLIWLARKCLPTFRERCRFGCGRPYGDAGRLLLES
jgi:O-antigen/teichoic acid export membrane protein